MQTCETTMYYNIGIGPPARARRCAIIALDYALLSLLAREPLSGYDLTLRMERPVGFFWHARRSQIYLELLRLEEAGLVTHAVVEQRDRPDKKVYTITEAGLARLRAWVTASTPMSPDRDEFMLKVFSIWLTDPEPAANMVRARERQHLQRLATYEEIKTRMEARWGELLRDVRTPQFASYATLRRGIEYERGYAEWCRWLAETLAASTGPGSA
jgi:DNA-binding PadR family transcriptional regulator